MGVKGLTSYVQNNSTSCMERYELHDSTLIIDGDSTAYQLYCNHFVLKNCCFGGDYDRYSNLIKSFFLMLNQCNIKPIFIFDGGYDERKMNTIRSRMRDRIRISGLIDCNESSKDILFPLFLGELFKDMAVQFNFLVIRCDYEGDLESANIAKSLGCPVLSNDSDFYIFGVLYIPFSSIKMETCMRSSIKSDKSYYYISCDLFVVEKFLKFIQLDRSMLPLFATLLGNDYINQRNISQLFRRDNNQRYNFHHKGWRYIKMLTAWLKNENLDSALEKISSICKPSEKETTKAHILETVNGYICKKSKYMSYINSEYKSDENKSNNSVNSSHTFFEIFYSNFRKCLYPSCFINMIFQNEYFIRPQVEDHSLPSSHMVSIEIISLINKILKNSTGNLKFYTRIGNDLSDQLIPICSEPIPTYLEIQKMDHKCRQQLLLNLLHIKEEFVENSLNYFPECWKLYIISIKYMCDKLAMNWSMIIALILCKLILTYFDKKVGYYRSKKIFMDTYKQIICKILIEQKQSEVYAIDKSISSLAENISKEDCLIAQKNFVSFFETDIELLKNKKVLNRKIVHSSSQFQSCFYHIGFLNSLLKFPYELPPISECFNGTFIYNMVNYLRSNSDESSISFLLQNASTVLVCFNAIMENLKRSINVSFLPTKQGFHF